MLESHGKQPKTGMLGGVCILRKEEVQDVFQSAQGTVAKAQIKFQCLLSVCLFLNYLEKTETRSLNNHSCYEVKKKY